MKVLHCLLVVFVFNSCCKVSMTFKTINTVQFINFTLQEVDTFYAIPSWYMPPFSDSTLTAYRETTSSLKATLSKTTLSANTSFIILLKDTITTYQVTASRSHNEKMGTGRCAGSNTVIDSIMVNGITKGGKTIEILK